MTIAHIDPAYRDTDPRAHFMRRVLLALYVVAGLVYLTWRLTVFNPDALLVSAIFYLVELGGFAGSLLLFFVVLQRQHRAPRPAPAGLDVDVFVTTVTEDIDTVRRTLVAAKRIRYPHETWLLDDGNRPAFRAMAAELRCRYVSRADNSGAKAGNLNNALRHSTGEFVALLDADHCADANFLDRLLGYFDEPDVAFVQTPQDYFNLNSFQHGRGRYHRLIWHEQSGFHHVEQPGRDHLGAATLCGCSCIMRRSHLDRIGGFPDDTVTEDMHAAVRLQKLGLRTVYHDEPLAFGVAAPDLIGFIRQRLRWGEGNMQVCRIERVPFSRQLTWQQNLGYLLLAVAYIDAWRKLALYVAPVATLITDIPPVYGTPATFLVFFLPYILIGVLTYQELYSGFGRILATEAYTMARLVAGLAATWGLFRRNIPFRISSKRLVGRIDVLLIAPYAAIFVAGLYAILDRSTNYFGVMAGTRPPGGIPMEVAAVLVLLVAYNCLLAFGVLREAWRSSTTREIDYQFDIVMPLRLSTRSGSAFGWTELISISGAVLPRPENCNAAVGDELAVEIFLPGHVTRTPARIVGCDIPHRLRLEFLWPTLHARDELDQALHAGRWHRVVTGRYEVVQSPLERLGLLHSPARERSARTIWEPVVVGGMWAPDEAVAFVRNADNDCTEIILFSDSQAVEIAMSRIPSLIGRRFRVVQGSLGVLLDEAALASKGGVRCKLEALESQISTGALASAAE